MVEQGSDQRGLAGLEREAVRNTLLAAAEAAAVPTLKGFRTPLAVIYSASENLADGVARDKEQVAKYGNLIKGEGRKLSGMVEQILQFAGARSGKKKYNFTLSRPADVVR